MCLLLCFVLYIYIHDSHSVWRFQTSIGLVVILFGIATIKRERQKNRKREREKKQDRQRVREIVLALAHLAATLYHIVTFFQIEHSLRGKATP